MELWVPAAKDIWFEPNPTRKPVSHKLLWAFGETLMGGFQQHFDQASTLEQAWLDSTQGEMTRIARP